MFQLSAIICTHNPRTDYLIRTLEGLKSQTMPKEQWELLLIDNASEKKLATSWDLSWHPMGRHVREEELGLTPARLRGIRESQAGLIVFVDDDNVLFPDYLALCLQVAQEWPLLGVWGGQQFPEFEHDSPTEDWKLAFWTGALKSDLWSNNYDRECVPSGSGVCVRRQIANRYADLAKSDGLRLNLGRKGLALNAAEDIDMAYVACDLGLGTGRLCSLRLTHLIPARRLNDDYLFKLCEGFGYSETIVEALRGRRPERPSRIDRLVTIYKQLRAKRKPRLDEKAWRKGFERALKVLGQ